jgi:hypothetical protein
MVLFQAFLILNECNPVFAFAIADQSGSKGRGLESLEARLESGAAIDFVKFLCSALASRLQGGPVVQTPCYRERSAHSQVRSKLQLRRSKANERRQHEYGAIGLHPGSAGGQD